MFIIVIVFVLIVQTNHPVSSKFVERINNLGIKILLMKKLSDNSTANLDTETPTAYTKEYNNNMKSSDESTFEDETGVSNMSWPTKKLPKEYKNDIRRLLKSLIGSSDDQNDNKDNNTIKMSKNNTKFYNSTTTGLLSDDLVTRRNMEDNENSSTSRESNYSILTPIDNQSYFYETKEDNIYETLYNATLANLLGETYINLTNISFTNKNANKSTRRMNDENEKEEIKQKLLEWLEKVESLQNNKSSNYIVNVQHTPKKSNKIIFNPTTSSEHHKHLVEKLLDAVDKPKTEITTTKPKSVQDLPLEKNEREQNNKENATEKTNVESDREITTKLDEPLILPVHPHQNYFYEVHEIPVAIRRVAAPNKMYDARIRLLYKHDLKFKDEHTKNIVIVHDPRMHSGVTSYSQYSNRMYNPVIPSYSPVSNIQYRQPYYLSPQAMNMQYQLLYNRRPQAYNSYRYSHPYHQPSRQAYYHPLNPHHSFLQK